MLNYNKDNINNAKQLRKEMTPWERKLYYTFLKKYKYKFYKQKLIHNYIIDFYCGQLKLAIELDGGQHYEENNLIYDALRSRELEKFGVKVLRFTNTEIDKHFNEVCEKIDNEVKKLE